MACQGCAMPHDITDRYCTNCGADLTPEHVACPNEACGYSYLAAGSMRLNYCPRCGAQMPEKES